jgi:hypothetical protein
MATKGKSPLSRENDQFHHAKDGKPDSVKVPGSIKKGDSRSRQTTKDISPQKPCGKFHG